MLFTDAMLDKITGRHTRAYLEDYQGKQVLFDSVMEINEEDRNEITDYAVESTLSNANNIEDNLIAKPKQVTVKSIMSDDAFILQQALGATASLATGGSPFNMFQYIPDRMERLQEWLDGKEILTYHGQDSDIESVVIESISRVRNRDTGSGVSVDIRLKQVTVADISYTAAPGTATKIKNTGTAKKVEQTSDKAPTKRVSMAKTAATQLTDMVK